MKIKSFSSFILLSVFFISFLISCNSGPSFNSADLNGTWNSVEAFRGGKKTESLSNTYFTFADGTLETNLSLSGEVVKGNYTLEGNKITETGANDLVYTIESLNPEGLTLSFELNSMEFKILLDKSK